MVEILSIRLLTDRGGPGDDPTNHRTGAEPLYGRKGASVSGWELPLIGSG
jgi:hypothetical protein